MIVEGSRGGVDSASPPSVFSRPAASTSAAAIGAAMLAASGAATKKAQSRASHATPSGPEAAVAALDDVHLVDRCRAAIARLPAEAVPAEARRIAFWCAFATADFNRRARDLPASASARRGLVEMIAVITATLARAREMAKDAPVASLSARRAVLESPALASGF